MGGTSNIKLIQPPRTQRIPDILSVEQAQKLFMTTDKVSYRVFFFTLYSMGLRLGEGLRLTVGDIDARRMRVHIRNAKGNKDRLVPLPENTFGCFTPLLVVAPTSDIQGAVITSGIFSKKHKKHPVKVFLSDLSGV